MFSNLKPALFSLAATSSILALYTHNLPVAVSYFFIALAIIMQILGIISLFTNKKKFITRLANPYESFSLFCLPFSLMLLVYKFSQFSLLTSPYAKYWLATALFLSFSIIVLLVTVLSKWEDESAIFTSFTMLSYLGYVIILAEYFKYQDFAGILTVIFIIGNVIFFLAAIFLLKTKLALPTYKGSLGLIFVNLLFLLPPYYPYQAWQSYYVLLAIIVFISSLLNVSLWWADYRSDKNSYKSVVALNISYALLAIHQFRENYLLVNLEQPNFTYWLNINWYQYLALTENALLFFASLLLMRHLLDNILPEKKKIK